MPYSNATQLVTAEDVTLALGGDNAGVEAADVAVAVAATIAYVGRFHATPYTSDVVPVVSWPADYKLGALKLATGLVRGGFAPAINRTDPNDPFAQGTLGRLTDIEIEQLLQIGRFAKPVIG